MTTVNEYPENTRKNRTDSFIITILFLILPIIGCAIVYFKDNYVLIYISVVFCTGFLLYFIIKPTYKVLAKKADHWEINSLKIAPFGIGLLCIYWPPYQRMARKLASDEAIQECKNAVNDMEINYFKDGWNAFSDWFSKIDSKENFDIKYSFISRALCARINHEKEEVRKELRKKLGSIMNSKAFQELDLADFLREELLDKTTHDYTYTEDEITKEALEKETTKRTSGLDELRENLVASNMDWTFKEMCRI